MDIEKVLEKLEAKPYQPKRRYVKQFAFCLQRVYDKGDSLDMTSTEKGSCGTPGCHGWLVRKALNFIDDVEESDTLPYHYDEEAFRLTWFLSTGKVLDIRQVDGYFKRKNYDSEYLEAFAADHPIWWGGHGGGSMFVDPIAFRTANDSCVEYSSNPNYIPESTVVAWWLAVSRRPVPKAK